MADMQDYRATIWTDPERGLGRRIVNMKASSREDFAQTVRESYPRDTVDIGPISCKQEWGRNGSRWGKGMVRR